MTRIELTISPQYVSNWGVWEAIREVLQNVIDNDDNEHIFNYDVSKQILTIGNKDTVLEKQTLLLGNSTKWDDTSKIGKYGEGYKLALLILARLGKRVVITNGSEIWHPKIINSRKYNSELLVIDIERVKSKGKQLEFKIHNISKQEFEEVMNKVLIYSDEINKIDTPYGEILIDDKYRRQIYVEGLYVRTMTECENMRYGYNIKAKYLELDRDRMSVSTFNLFWETSRMFNYLIGENKKEYRDMIYEMIKKKLADVSYVTSMGESYNKTEMFSDICELCADDFVKTYGTNAVVVSNEVEAKAIKEKYNNAIPVVVPEVITHYINNSYSYRTSKNKILSESEKPTPYTYMKKFLENHSNEFSGELKNEFEKLVESSRNWTFRG